MAKQKGKAQKKSKGRNNNNSNNNNGTTNGNNKQKSRQKNKQQQIIEDDDDTIFRKSLLNQGNTIKEMDCDGNCNCDVCYSQLYILSPFIAFTFMAENGG